MRVDYTTCAYGYSARQNLLKLLARSRLHSARNQFRRSCGPCILKSSYQGGAYISYELR